MGGGPAGGHTPRQDDAKAKAAKPEAGSPQVRKDRPESAKKTDETARDARRSEGGAGARPEKPDRSSGRGDAAASSTDGAGAGGDDTAKKDAKPKSARPVGVYRPRAMRDKKDE